MPLVVPSQKDLIAAGGGAVASLLGAFTDKDIILDPHRYEKIQIGEQVLPFQPLVSYRQRKNMVITQIAGSAQDYDLSGATVKEDMGLGEAYIVIEGLLMSFDPTPMQRLSELVGQSNVAGLEFEKTWVKQLTELRLLFEEEGSLPITDKNDRFLSLGIDKVVLRGIRVNDVMGAERKIYRLDLLQDRDLEMERFLQIEET